MKGVVLAGGLGTRLLPLTKITNKHLLPIFDKPMIYYPLQTLINAGIEDIMIVTGGNNAGDFLRLLGNGKQFGLKDISYTYQEGEGGIAEALDLARNFADGEKVLIVLGDNIIEKNVIKEKPENPKTDHAVIGIYMYDSRVFDIIKTLERSDRGELEITDVNNAYIEDGTMTCSVLDGWWIDAGSSPENLAEATQLVIKTGANNLT